MLAVCRRHEDELRGGRPAELSRIGVNGEAEARQVTVRHVEYRPIAVTVHFGDVGTNCRRLVICEDLQRTRVNISDGSMGEYIHLFQ